MQLFERESWLRCAGEEIGCSFTRFDADQYMVHLSSGLADPAYGLKLIDYAFARFKEIYPRLRLAWDDLPPHIVLLADLDELLGYYALWDAGHEEDFDAEDPGTLPGGFWTSHPFCHIAIRHHRTDGIDAALGHELVHACLMQYDTPLWLEEGLAVNLEIFMGNRRHPLSTAEQVEELSEYFQEHDPLELLAEDAFVEAGKARYHYDLAALVVSTLLRHHDNAFWDILPLISSHAGGRESLAEHLGVDLEQLLRSMFQLQPARGWLARLMHRLCGLS